MTAFRGHGFSLLALAKGMSTLFAKNGFSRPSLRYCGVFRHVLFPQDKEGTRSIYIARRKLVCIFEESVIFRFRPLKYSPKIKYLITIGLNCLVLCLLLIIFDPFTSWL